MGWSLSQVRALPSEEFLGWLEYLSWRNEEERKAYKKSSGSKGKPSRR